MYCNPEEIYRKDKGWIKSLYISYLNTFGNQRKGLGTILLNIAKKWSEGLGYEGRFHVFASSIRPSEAVSHVFYKKYGMNTGLLSIDRKIDRLSKQKRPITNLELQPREMYYPPIEYNVGNNTPFFKHIMKSILSYFSISNSIK